jgi:periplasmic divalent cation tolerance protein
MTECVLVLTTIPADQRGHAIAKALVEERLAACVNLLPQMRSTYRWQGAVTEDTEHQLVIKTTRARLPEVERRLHELHPYEVPEFLVVDVASGSERYLSWVEENARVR